MNVFSGSSINFCFIRYIQFFYYNFSSTHIEIKISCC